MIRRWGLGLSALAVLAAAVVLVAVVANDNGAADDQLSRTLTVGALFSLTGGGNVYGPQQERGARLAINEINAAGGIDHARLRLVVRDDASLPSRGKELMRQLIERDRAVAVLGPSLSLVAVIADPIASAHRTPVLAVSNTADGIVGKCAYDCSWIWRNSLGEETAVTANLLSFAADRHVPSAAIVHVSNDVLAADEAAIARTAFRQAGVPVVADASTPRTGSVVPAVRRVLTNDPAALFIGATFGQTAADIMQAARELGFRGTFLGGNTFNSSATIALAGKAGMGARSGAAWYEGNDFPANQRFIASYRQIYGDAPDQFAAQAYAGVQMLAEAVRRGRVGSRAGRLDQQRAWMARALPGVALTTPLGTVRFTADHDVSQTVWILRMTGRGHALVGFCTPVC